MLAQLVLEIPLIRALKEVGLVDHHSDRWWSDINLRHIEDLGACAQCGARSARLQNFTHRVVDASSSFAVLGLLIKIGNHAQQFLQTTAVLGTDEYDRRKFKPGEFLGEVFRVVLWRKLAGDQVPFVNRNHRGLVLFLELACETLLNLRALLGGVQKQHANVRAFNGVVGARI